MVEGLRAAAAAAVAAAELDADPNTRAAAMGRACHGVTALLVYSLPVHTRRTRGH